MKCTKFKKYPNCLKDMPQRQGLSQYKEVVPMLKVRRFRDSLIFNMENPIYGKDNLYIEKDPGRLSRSILHNIPRGFSRKKVNYKIDISYKLSQLVVDWEAEQPRKEFPWEILTMSFTIMSSNITYRKTSCISRTKSQNLNVSCIPLQLSSLNLLKPRIKLRMKM